MLISHSSHFFLRNRKNDPAMGLCFLTSVLLLKHFRVDVSYDLRILRSKIAAFSPLPPSFLKVPQTFITTLLEISGVPFTQNRLMVFSVLWS